MITDTITGLDCICVGHRGEPTLQQVVEALTARRLSAPTIILDADHTPVAAIMGIGSYAALCHKIADALERLLELDPKLDREEVARVVADLRGTVVPS